MEFIKRVWAEKFTLTDAQKADIKANKAVEWQGENVKHNGADRFHVLLTVAGTHQAIYEGQWLVKDSPNTEILWDEQFKARYSTPGVAPEATKPIRSEALQAFLTKHQPSTLETTEGKPEKPKDTDLDKSSIAEQAPISEAIKPEVAADERATEALPTPSLNGVSHE